MPVSIPNTKAKGQDLCSATGSVQCWVCDFGTFFHQVSVAWVLCSLNDLIQHWACNYCTCIIVATTRFSQCFFTFFFPWQSLVRLLQNPIPLLLSSPANIILALSVLMEVSCAPWFFKTLSYPESSCYLAPGSQVVCCPPFTPTCKY